MKYAFTVKKPCSSCPFTTSSLAGWLGAERMQSICDETVLGDGYFVCHKTISSNKQKERLCAGKLILEGRVNRYGNSSTRIGIALGLIPKNYALQGAERVFETIADAVKHHSFSIEESDYKEPNTMV